MTIQYQGQVKPEWLDYNGHMNLAYYVLAFDYATEAFYEQLGLGEKYIKIENQSMFTIEIDVVYRQELLLGEKFYIRTWLQNYNEKLLHYLHQMYHSNNDELVATNECMAVNVDMTTRRSTQLKTDIQDSLANLEKQQQQEQKPLDVEWRLAIRK